MKAGTMVYWHGASDEFDKPHSILSSHTLARISRRTKLETCSLHVYVPILTTRTHAPGEQELHRRWKMSAGFAFVAYRGIRLRV